MAIFPNFVGPSYTVQSPSADCERLINRYIETMEAPGAKAPAVLNPISGLSAFGQVVGASAVLDLFTVNGRTFTTAGGALGEVADSGAVAHYGLVTIDTHPASFACSGDAGDQLAIATGGNCYILTLSTNALGLATSDVNVVGYLNGTFYGLDTVNAILRASDPLDGYTWNGLAVEERTSAPDRWQTLIIVNGDVWVFGSQTADVYYDAGLTPFPLALRGTLPYGIAARDAVAVLDSAPAWLAQTSQGPGMVMHAVNGYGTPRRISTHAVETAIAGYRTISDAQAFSYQEQGHSFFVLRFPSENACWTYDAATAQWHERLYWNPTIGSWQTYRPACHTYNFGKHLVGDASSGAIFALSSTVSTDVDGNGIRWLRRCPHLTNEQKRIVYRSLQLDMDVGVGVSSGQGSDPQMVLRISRDGGRTFGNEHWAGVGAIGAYRTRVIWDRLGMARDAVFEVSGSDPVPYRLTAAYLDYQVGLH